METKSSLSTLTLLIKALEYKKYSCDPVADGVIHVSYKEYNFMMNEYESNIIQVFDGFWREIPLDEDVDLIMLFSVINECNTNAFSRIVYTLEEEKNVLALHTYCTLACIPSTFADSSIAETAKYISHVFDSIVDVRNMFQSILEEKLGERLWTQPGAH